MPRPRPFPVAGSQAGVFHVVSRVAGRDFVLGEVERDFFTRLVHAYARLLGVEVLTHCTMSNHFHLLLRVPQRPAQGSGEPTIGQLLERMEAAVGAEQMRQVRRTLALWESSGLQSRIEEWRRRQVAAMYSLSEYMKRLKQRFARWYNRRTGRIGVFWEDRYRSTIVEEGSSALRMVATYIDLNPVRAGVREDPGRYRWSGYAEALAGSREALEGIAWITGLGGECAHGSEGRRGMASESAGQRRRRLLRALVRYRQMLGQAGRERVREDGTVVRRGLKAEVVARLERESGVRREQVMERVRQFTRGVVVGSRGYVEEWFGRNRHVVLGGGSLERRQTGARPLGRKWKGLYCLRRLRTPG